MYFTPLVGRRKIYTSEKEITRANVCDVVSKAYTKHRLSMGEEQYLLNYERGIQPLDGRTKKIRPEINIHVVDNLANVITGFKKSYFWANPAMLVQRGDTEVPEADEKTDDRAISKLNGILVNNVHIGYEDQKMADSAEICGVGYRYIDVRGHKDLDGLPFEYSTLDPKYAFCVYYDGISERKMLGVTFSKTAGKLSYTAYTETERFDIERGEVVNATRNILGMIPIVEYERDIDRTGCFERLIRMMDAHNIKLSDLSNDISQHTQEIWWGNDIAFPEDEQGNPVSPRSGQWILTYTGGEGNNPNIKPLSGTLDGSGTLQVINDERIAILTSARVPIQYESEGGGSTGVAMDISSGWSNAEADALRQEQIIKKSKFEELALMLRAIELAPAEVVPANDILREIRLADCDFHFNRRKNYDMTVKANAFATYVSHGLHGRHALKEIDAFSDVEQVWNDSKDLIEAYQKSQFINSSKQTGDDRTMQDNSDQIVNSPNIDGMNTAQDGGEV